VAYRHGNFEPIGLRLQMDPPRTEAATVAAGCRGCGTWWLGPVPTRSPVRVRGARFVTWYAQGPHEFTSTDNKPEHLECRGRRDRHTATRDDSRHWTEPFRATICSVVHRRGYDPLHKPGMDQASLQRNVYDAGSPKHARHIASPRIRRRWPATLRFGPPGRSSPIPAAVLLGFSEKNTRLGLLSVPAGKTTVIWLRWTPLEKPQLLRNAVAVVGLTVPVHSAESTSLTLDRDV
jgi:hypothetical protein